MPRYIRNIMPEVGGLPPYPPTPPFAPSLPQAGPSLAGAPALGRSSGRRRRPPRPRGSTRIRAGRVEYVRPGASGGPGGAPLCPAGTPGRSEDVRGADRAGPRGEHRSGPGEPARPRGEPGRAPGGGRPRSAVRPAPAGPQRAPRARAASPRPAGRPRGGRGEGKILLPGGRRTATQRPPRGVCLGGEKKSGAGGGGGAGAVGAAGRPAAPRASSRLFPGFFQAAFFQEGFSRFFSRQLFPESFFQAADGWESPSIVVGGGWGTLGSSKGGGGIPCSYDAPRG